MSNIPNNSYGVLSEEKEIDSNIEIQQRTFTKIELQGLEKALVAIKEQSMSYKEQGLSEKTFFIGVLNLVATSMMVFRFPQYYWIYQAGKCILMLSAMWRINLRRKDQFYFCEFCWWMVHLFVFYSIIKLFKAFGYYTFLSDIPGIKESCFHLFWGFANGPLGMAVITFSNALLLHSMEHMASLVIHLSPNMVIWTLRWNAILVEKTWPGVFGMPLPGSPPTTFLDIFIPSLKMYSIWLCFYLTWQVFYGRFNSKKMTGYSTLFHWNMENSQKMRKLCRFDEENPTAMVPVLIHQVIHGAYSLFLIGLSYFMFYRFWLHTLYIAILFMAAVRQGAIRYIKMMTRFNEKRIEKLIQTEKQKMQ